MRLRRAGMLVLCGALVACATAVPSAAQTRSKPVDVIGKPAPPTDPKNKIGLDYEYENFNNTFTDWHWLSLEYSHRFDPVTILGRVNWAHRYDQDATQYEVDAYPKLWKGAYLYLNYGVSEHDSFFPDRRFGAELFWNVGHAKEVSVGYRRLEYDPRSVDLYTGSFGWYSGNWFCAVRPWVSNKPGDTSVSGSFMARRYLATRDDHWTLRIGGGQGSDFDQSIDELLLSSQWSVTGEWQRRFRPMWIARAKAGFHSVDYETGTNRQSWLVGGGISRLF